MFVLHSFMYASMRTLPFFFSLSACSWMPHWACHYYRLETGSSFVVGSWSFSLFDSYVSMVVYSTLILLNLVSVVTVKPRITAAAFSGVLHVGIGLLHVYRLWSPFRFEVFGYAWSWSASLREVAIVLPFGLLCLYIAWRLYIAPASADR